MLRCARLLLIVSAAAAQPSTSANAMLRGKFQFREIALMTFDDRGNPVETAAAYGSIAFDGAGRYTVDGFYIDNTISNGAPHALGVYGTYSVASSGLARMTDPLAPSDPASLIYGAVAQGVFAGSATEGRANNLLIAISANSTPSLDAAYSVGALDFTGGIRNAAFQLAAAGPAVLAKIDVSGQINGADAAQTVAGASYSLPGNGTVALNFPAPSQLAAGALIAGTRTLVQSADKNFVLAWNPAGYDLVFGVKSGAVSDAMFHGLYYTAALESTPVSSCGSAASSYGSLLADGAGSQIVHRRLASPLCYVIDYQTDGHASPAAPQSGGDRYWFAAGGQAFVAIGSGGVASLIAGIRAPDVSAPGVFLNPAGIVNAASNAPVTMNIAPGELIALYGSGLSSVTRAMQGGQSFPASLEGVQVLMDGAPAPIYYVSPTQISAVVPTRVRFNTSGVVSIQVINNGTSSNTVTMLTGNAAPGIFTQTATGLGYAAAIHASGALVTPANPAHPGETIAIFLTGLGSVSPAPADGAAVPTPAAADQPLSVYLNDYNQGISPKAAIRYAGLAPGLAGVYQLNIEIPASIGAGDIYVEIVSGTADINQAIIPVAR